MSTMRSIRFSDQVASSEDVSLLQQHHANHGLRRTASYAMPMRDFPSRRFEQRAASAASHHVPSYAASDTSSAAGFGTASRYNSSRLHRAYAIDDTFSLRGLQREELEVDYGGGRGFEAASVTTSSAGGYSPTNASSSVYNNSNNNVTPILKNGTLPTSRASASSRAGSAYGGTLERQRGVNGGMGQRSAAANRAIYASSGGGASFDSTRLYNGGGRSSQYSKRRSAGGVLAAAGAITGQPSVDSSVPDDRSSFPTLPRRTNSVPVIATPHRPLCDCSGCVDILCSGGVGGFRLRGSAAGGTARNGGQHAPICLLFSVFLIFSLLVVSGIMIYLRGGN